MKGPLSYKRWLSHVILRYKVTRKWHIIYDNMNNALWSCSLFRKEKIYIEIYLKKDVIVIILLKPCN